MWFDTRRQTAHWICQGSQCVAKLMGDSDVRVLLDRRKKRLDRVAALKHLKRNLLIVVDQKTAIRKPFFPKINNWVESIKRDSLDCFGLRHVSVQIWEIYHFST